MKRQCNAEAGGENAEKGTERRNRPAFRITLDHPRPTGVPVCIDSLKNPTPSRSLVEIGVIIVNICSRCVHPREFLFVSSDGFIRRPVSAFADDTVEPFAGDL